MRGIQKTNAKGVATFQTVYPGWYQGRTVHIHVKVHLGGNVVHTGQLYFSDAMTDSVYRKAPYNKRPNRDVRNASDSVYRDGGKSSEVLSKGLPQSHAYDVVYRHALALDETGERLAFGSTTGGLWVSEDQGDSWAYVTHTLPPIYAVRFT
jgi:hypothetical protein